jgi:hypothetical protein
MPPKAAPSPFTTYDALPELNLDDVAKVRRGSRGWPELSDQDETAPFARLFSSNESLSRNRQHNKPDDLWTVIDSVVYNLTVFQNLHPGGEVVLQAAGVAGKDSSVHNLLLSFRFRLASTRSNRLSARNQGRLPSLVFIGPSFLSFSFVTAPISLTLSRSCSKNVINDPKYRRLAVGRIKGAEIKVHGKDGKDGIDPPYSSKTASVPLAQCSSSPA